MPFSFFIATRYRKKQPTKGLPYRLARLSCYSTALGTTILLLVLATMGGIENLLSSFFYSYSATLKIEAKKGKTFMDNGSLKASIADLPGIIDIVEVLETTALIALEGQQTIATIQGLSANFGMGDFYKNCRRIDRNSFSEVDHALIGITLSKKLQLTADNHTITLFYPKPNPLNHGFSIPYKQKKVVVEGIFSIEPTLDRTTILVPIGLVERLTNSLNKRSYWEVVIQEPTNLTALQRAIQKALPDGLKVVNRYEGNETRNRAIRMERCAVYFIASLILLLASLHIFFMLCMLLLEKKKDITILAALGATPYQIGKIFWKHGLLITLEGIAYGIIIGWFIALLQQKLGILHFTIAKRNITYPIDLKGINALQAAMITILWGGLATLWPAKWAMQWSQLRK